MGSPAGLTLVFHGQADAGLVVALGVAALAVALLALRGLVDWLLGPEAPTATYRLVETDGGLVLADEDEAKGQRLVGLDDEAMLALLDRAEQRNEMRLHTVLGAGGTHEDWEEWRGEEDRRAPAGVVIEDSRGLVEVHASGRVDATPPLDEAVRGDLVEVLASALDVELHGRG